MNRPGLLAACLAGGAMLVGAGAQAGATPLATRLAECAAVAAADARLDCYDKLAGRMPGVERPSAAGTDGGKPPPSAGNEAADPRNFGLSAAQLHPTEQGPASVQARVSKFVPGSLGLRGSVVIDNGQTWVFTDAEADGRLRVGDAVTIRRAALGSFMLITGSKRSYHVRRSQ